VVAAAAALPLAPEEWEQEIEESLKLVALLPPSVASVLESHPQLFELLEVVMDLGRPPIARFPSGDVRLTEEAVTNEDLQYAVDQVRRSPGGRRS
jgi:stage III sporulation protein SpoIIIAA